ncbi:unnamed protein product [Auanema sp. JU1783]|nr:unnamed protein product [Auanema sp. JU1783]
MVASTNNSTASLNHIAILGYGLMGSGIAQICLQNGYKVSIYGRNPKRLVECSERIRWGLVKHASKANKLDKEEVNSVVDQQMSCLSYNTVISKVVQNADMVIEAVAEDLQLKRKIFEEVQEYCPSNALLITNTSSIRLMDIVECIENPAHFAGLHFFNPVPLIKLVEVVSTSLTSDETKQVLIEFCRTIDKTSIACKDTPGFIVNRLLIPYLIESIRMVERGDATMEDIDAGMRCGTNYPMGPLELCDYVGLDTLQNVMKVWRESMPNDSRFEPCALLDSLVEQGKLGRKTKQGFYSY